MGTYINIITPTDQDYEAVIKVLSKVYDIPWEGHIHNTHEELPSGCRGLWVYHKTINDDMYWNAYLEDNVREVVKVCKDNDPNEPRITARQFLENHTTLMGRYFY